MGNPDRHPFQILKRERTAHGIELRTKTGNPRNALATEMESANRLAGKDLDHPSKDQPEGCCAST